jgi:hypothetical protein
MKNEKQSSEEREEGEGRGWDDEKIDVALFERSCQI